MIVNSAIIFLCVILLVFDHRKESRQKILFYFILSCLTLINDLLLMGLNNVFLNVLLFTTNVYTLYQYILYQDVVIQVGTGSCCGHVS